MLRLAIGIIIPAIMAYGGVKSPKHHKHSQRVKSPTRLSKHLGWHLNGGVISGDFLSPLAKADWPVWMQALVGYRTGASVKELAEADLYKVPDAFLIRALDTLRTRGVFTPKVLRQVTGIMHAAQAVEFQKAKTAYQSAYIATMGLPVDDAVTCSRVMTQLKNEGYGALVASALYAKPFPPGDPVLQAAFRRMLQEKPSREAVLDRARPDIERLYFLTKLRWRGDTQSLLESFRGSKLMDRAIFYAVEEGWVTINHPLVAEACAQAGVVSEGPWFMMRPIERASDLGWKRTMEALRRSDFKTAIEAARLLLNKHPDSYYGGHATTLLSVLSPQEVLSKLSLRVPADVTLFNANLLKEDACPLELDWPEKYRSLANAGRFDLIMIGADPDQQTDLYLMAAHACGQIDLVGRYLSVERKFGPDTFTSNYPVFLEAYINRIIQEEGVGDVVDPAFVMAMMKNESLFQPVAKSGSMAYGLLQLLKPTFRAMMGRRADIRNPEMNVRGGIRYYARIAKAAGLRGLPPVVRQAYIAAGYHAGEGRAKRWKRDIEAHCQYKTDPVNLLYRIDSIPIHSTKQYVTRVLGDAEVYRAILAGRE